MNGYTTERIKLLIMGISKIIKKCLLYTCVCFTVITAVYMLILQITNLDEGSAAVESDRVLLFFMFSLLFSAANSIRSIKQLNVALGYVIHYIICVFAFYACFLLPVDMRPSFMVTGIVIFTLLYVIVAFFTAIFSAKLRANRDKSVRYTNQFKK